MSAIFFTLQFSDLEAEVLYATRHEYACTAIDVLARRTRLAFVNAQAAFVALPRVIEIMGAELSWSGARQREEFERGVKFLESMGLPHSVAVNGYNNLWPSRGSTTWIGSAKDWCWCLLGIPSAVPAVLMTKGLPQLYSRAKFEAGEVEALREIFDRYAVVPSATRGMPEGVTMVNKVMTKDQIKTVLSEFAKEWPGCGYEGFRDGDYRYVLAEAGIQNRVDVEFDEFVEVSHM